MKTGEIKVPDTKQCHWRFGGKDSFWLVFKSDVLIQASDYFVVPDLRPKRYAAIGRKYAFVFPRYSSDIRNRITRLI